MNVRLVWQEIFHPRTGPLSSILYILRHSTDNQSAQRKQYRIIDSFMFRQGTKSEFWDAFWQGYLG